MAKTYLNTYWVEEFQALNVEGLVYKLELETHRFWGWWKSTKIVRIEVRGSIKKTTDKWDSLIASRKPLK